MQNLVSNYLKKFAQWFIIKPQLDAKDINTKIKIGQIWWCSIGENIGGEIGGKDKLFLRPLYIINKFSTSTFTGLPLTTKFKNGKYFYKININSKISFICLHQGRFLDTRRLLKKIETVSEQKQSEILDQYLDLYRNNTYSPTKGKLLVDYSKDN